MAEIPKVGELNDLAFGEYDDRSLNIILETYADEETPRLALTPFINTYLPVLARKHPREEDQAAVRRMWIEEVAKTNRYPVFIVDDSDEKKILYRVPPLIGTVHTGITGHEGSMNSLDQLEQSHKDRLSNMGARVRKEKFNSFGAISSVNRNYQLDWIRILFDFGYLQQIHDVVGDGPYPEDIAAIIGEGPLDIKSTEAPVTSAEELSDTTRKIGTAPAEKYIEEDF